MKTSEKVMKPLLVGEANPYQSDPRLAQRYALYPDPPHCAGWNLCHKILQLSEGEYLSRFDRVNLCHRNWSVIEARKKAVEVSSDERTFVLFGAKVTRVFAWMLGHEDNFNPFTWHEESHRVGPLETPTHVVRRYLVLPHPSGLSRAWNEPGAYERARSVLREAGVL